MSENVRERPEFENENCHILQDGLELLLAEAKLPNLKPRQQLALQLLLAGSTDTAVAAQLKLNPRTIYRWRHSPVFQAHLDLCRRALYDNGAHQFLSLVTHAMQLLTERLNDPYDAPRAIQTILSAAKVSDHLSCPPDLYPTFALEELDSLTDD